MCSFLSVFPTYISRLVFSEVYFPICILPNCISLTCIPDLYFSDLYFSLCNLPICMFRLVFPDLYFMVSFFYLFPTWNSRFVVPESYFPTCIFELNLLFLFLRFVLPICISRVRLFRCVFSDLSFRFVFPVLYLYDLYFPMCICLICILPISIPRNIFFRGVFSDL